jgi:hypothetical protein
MPSSPSQNSDEPPGLLKTLAAVFSGVLFGLFLSKLDEPPENRRQAIGPQDSTANPQSGANTLPVTVVQVVNSEPQKDQTNWSKDNAPFRKKVYEWGVAAGTIGLLVVNIFLMRYTREAANAAKESADLSRQIAEGQNAAFFNIAIDFTGEGRGELTVNMRNDGKVIGEIVSGQITVYRESMPSLRKIGEAQIFPVKQSVLVRPGDGNPESVQIIGFDRSSYMAHTEGIHVEIVYQYKNGFGKVIPQSLCFVNWDMPPGHAVNSIPCDDVPFHISQQAEFYKKQ